jgi:hypothetical protein
MKIPIVLLTILSLAFVQEHSHKHHTGHDHDDNGDTDLPDDFDGTQEKLSQDGLAWVSYVTESGSFPESTEFSVNVTLADPSNPTASLNDAVITLVDATMPAHGGHGMTVTPDVTDNGDGTAVAGPIKLHMPGYWVLRVDLEVNGAEDAAEFDIECCD